MSLESRSPVSRRDFLAALGCLGSVAGVASADHRRFKANVRCEPGLPGYAYRAKPSPLGTTAVSHTALAAASTPDMPTDLKIFQMKTASLDLGHCSLSRVALVIRKSGSWIASFQADQNPVVKPSTTIEPLVLLDGRGGRLPQTDFIKRNIFHVRLRGMGAAPANDASGVLGVPEYALIDLPPFVVERAVPYSYRRASAANDAASEDIQNYFALLDHFVVDFSFT